MPTLTSILSLPKGGDPKKHKTKLINSIRKENQKKKMEKNLIKN